MRSAFSEAGHAHRLQRLLHPAADFQWFHPQILRTKGHIVLHHGSNQLVVGILEDHAHLAPHLPQLATLSQFSGIHALHAHMA